MEPIHQQGLQVTVQAIDGDRAVLLLPDGQIVRWPLAQLPAGTKSGDVIGLHAGTHGTKDASTSKGAGSDVSIQLGSADMHELAHAVINRIFNAEQSEV